MAIEIISGNSTLIQSQAASSHLRRDVEREFAKLAGVAAQDADVRGRR